MNKEYVIEPPKTGKSKIKHPRLAEENVIAKLGSSILLIGVTKSGKSCLLYNLLSRKEFYGDSFDQIFLISPAQDDSLDDLDIPPECKFSDLKKATEALTIIQKHQKAQIAKHGIHKASQFALVLDDVIGNQKFMKHEQVVQSFVAGRHANETVFLCSQHLRSVPKVSRLQATFVCIFQCSPREFEILLEEYQPPGINKKQFYQMCNDIWSEPFQFLCIHRLCPLEHRYRKGLGQPVDLAYYGSLQ